MDLKSENQEQQLTQSLEKDSKETSFLTKKWLRSIQILTSIFIKSNPNSQYYQTQMRITHGQRMTI